MPSWTRLQKSNLVKTNKEKEEENKTKKKIPVKDPNTSKKEKKND